MPKLISVFFSLQFIFGLSTLITSEVLAQENKKNFGLSEGFTNHQSPDLNSFSDAAGNVDDSKPSFSDETVRSEDESEVKTDEVIKAIPEQSVRLFENEALSLEKKSLWLPAFSLLFPGGVQAWDGRVIPAASFVGYGLAGVGLSSHANYQYDQNFQSLSNDEIYNLSNLDQVGSSMFVHAGLLSGWESFDERVKAYQQDGKYQRIKGKNSLKEILLAPFNFGHLKNMTTWIPFTVALVSGYQLTGRGGVNAPTFTGSDIGAAGVRSFNAGTGEEAYFRGYLLPVFYETMGNRYLAQGSQAALFGAAHGFSRPPVFQFLAGLYLGWLVEENDFNLEEAIFIHTWWDFWIISGLLISDRNGLRNNTLTLPVFQMRF